MQWINLLHFYQPYNQQDDILLRIVNECYRPLIKGFTQYKKSKTLVNMNGALTKLLLDRGYEDVINGLKLLALEGIVEFTGSAMYHAFLPLLPENEIERQIKLNDEENKKYCGEVYKPDGFFSPEMAVNDKVLKVVKELGYKWLAAPELSYGTEEAGADKLYTGNDSGLFVFFRNKRVSALILGAVVRSGEDLLYETQDLQKKNKYWFTVMDAETFGHHRIGYEKVLFELLASHKLQSAYPSGLIKDVKEVEEVNLRPTTWTNQEQDFWLDRERTQYTESKSFILWKNTENPIHNLQWQFVEFCLSTLGSCNDKDTDSWKNAREKMDKALASDQFWWASALPWWSLEMVEQGAFALREVIYTGEFEAKTRETAEKLYRDIVDQAFEWQRSGYIRRKHLENSSTFMKDSFGVRTPPEWYNQIILEFEDEMNKSARRQDFEKAIKWRDAIIKLNQGTDIYDVLHVVDELWAARHIPSVKPFLEQKWEEFSDLARESFKNVKTKEDFEKWVKESGRL